MTRQRNGRGGGVDGVPEGARVVLVGAGHAHLHTVSRASEFRARGIELALVSPDLFWYSGLATGVLSGYYPPEMDRVDMAATLEAAGGRALRTRVERIDPNECVLHLTDGGSLGYDVLSLNVGSEVSGAGIPGVDRHALPVKPVKELIRRGRESPVPKSGDGDGGSILRRIVVLGGGASGCEVAANLAAFERTNGRTPRITLVTRSELISGAPEGARAYARRTLRRLGIEVMENAPVHEVEACRVGLDGGTVAADLIIDATGLRAPKLLADSGLAVDEFGSMKVDAHLRSTRHPNVFGAGDCVALEGHELAKVGVYAIRQAPVLTHNLGAMVWGDALREFVPQSRFLLILNLGEGRGLAMRGGLWFGGRIAFWLKDWIDRRFLRRYRSGQPTSSRS